MTKEELQPFCNPCKDRMAGPFSVGDYSYATNGHILVRVPRLPDVPEWEAVNGGAAKQFDAVDYPASTAALVDIPDFPEPEAKPCRHCKGTGKTSTCPECYGSGEVDFENDFNEYCCECLTCHGNGTISGSEEICEYCSGTGKDKFMTPIPVGCCLFSSHYLTMLKELPGVKIAPLEQYKPAYFKWDEGDGLLMPMRG